MTARFPKVLSSQVPWRQVQPGVYDCHWGTDTLRVVVAGELSREPHNAPLHLFSAQPALIEFGGRTYRQRSKNTGALLGQLFEGLQAEGFNMPFTMEDFQRQFVKKHFPKLSEQDQEEVLRQYLDGLPPEKRLAGLTEDQIRQYLDQLSTGRSAPTRKPRRKK